MFYQIQRDAHHHNRHDCQRITLYYTGQMDKDSISLYRDILYRDKQRKTLLYCGVS